jgi:hypothetical protein
MKTAWKLVSFSAVAAVMAGCSHTTEREIVREQPVVQQAAPSTTVEHVTVLQPPPAPTEQMPPAPSASGYAWLPGHYEWQSGDWHWQPGRWQMGAVEPMPPAMQETIPTPPFASARWVPGYWSFAENRWVWVRGHWQ